MTTSGVPRPPRTSSGRVSLRRRNALRACYLLLVVGLGVTAWPRLLAAHPGRPLEEGVVDVVLCAIQLLALVGLLAPVRMLPLLVFEVVWKTLWIVSVALPLWWRGNTVPGVAGTVFACAWAVPFVVVIPWRVLLRSVGTPEPWAEPRQARRGVLPPEAAPRAGGVGGAELHG